jgi:ferritin-like metal-binding protein YciE
MELTTLRSLFIHELKDLYSAEKQLIKALPKAAKAATNPDLKAGIEEHLEETIEHASRLENVLTELGETTRGAKCRAMEGLIAEASAFMEEEADPEVLDAGIIAGAQKIEHYEIAGYGCARAYAELLGEDEAAGILQTTLDEEHSTDEKLTELAMSVINVAAIEGEEEETSARSGQSRRAGRGEASGMDDARSTKAAGKSGKGNSRRRAPVAA